LLPSNSELKETRRLLYDYIIFMANTGIRASEAKHLRWRHIDFNDELVKLDARITKNRKPREVVGRDPAMTRLRQIWKRRTSLAKVFGAKVKQTDYVFSLPNVSGGNLQLEQVKWSCYAKVESTYCNRRCSMGRGIRFTTEFKREAVRLVLTSGRPRAEIAEDLGVGLSSLTRWIGQYRDEEMPPEIKDDLQAELKRLRKENAVLRQERDILKKAAAFFAKEGSR
jgi:transposase